MFSAQSSELPGDLPHDAVSDRLVLLRGHPVQCEAGSFGVEEGNVVGEHVIGADTLECVEPHQQGEVGETLDEVDVVEFTFDELFGQIEKDRRVRESWPHRYPVVRLRGLGPVLGDYGDDLPSPLDDLLEKVALRHLVLDQVLAHLDQKPAVPQIVEINLGRLQTVNKGKTGRLVSAPGVFRPVASSLCFVGPNPANTGIEEGHHVGESEQAELARHAVQGERRADLHGPHPRALPELEHLGLVAVGLEQTATTVLSRIGAGYGLETSGQIVVDLVPPEADKAVVTPIVKEIPGSQCWII